MTTANVLASSRRQYSMDSGYDERGLRLRTDSQGNGDTDHEETSITGEDNNGGWLCVCVCVCHFVSEGVCVCVCV